MDVKGSSALVTGGASGLGEATARRLAALGAKVLILDRDDKRGPEVAESLGNGSGFAKADVISEEEVRAACEAANALAPLRVVVNCAGVGWAKRTINRKGEPHPLDFFKTVVDINLIGTFNVLRLGVAIISQNDPVDGERGVVINTASVAAFDGQIGQAAYAASKAAVVGLTLPVARDLSAVGIRVCTIAPGIFDTPMLSLLPEPAREKLAANVPFPRRLGDPAEYAKLVAAIVENGYLNGEVIRLDAALRMAPK